MVKFGIIKEGKVPSDERVPLVPAQIVELLSKHSKKISIDVEQSAVRRIKDQEYIDQGVNVVPDLAHCDVLIGVKEVPKEQLMAHKTYLFFSHTIKKQPYNKALLQKVMEQKITLIDWETLRDAKGRRIIGFGRYAGIVGAYNGFRMIGMHQEKFSLKKAHLCQDRAEVNRELKKVNLGPIKILLTGRGKVAKGAIEILKELGIQKVTANAFLNEQFNAPVYCQINFDEYFKRKDQKPFVNAEFYSNPGLFESDFSRFAKVTDFYIAGHFWGSGSPYLFTRQDAKSPDFRIKYIADISCDIDGPVASTIRPSTITEPFYGYDPVTEGEVAFGADGAINVMAVDNLPCELPRDASKDFGEMFIHHVLPSFLNNDKHGILKRAMITNQGEITEPYAYLKEWVNA